jgi:hypothetical protein
MELLLTVDKKIMYIYVVSYVTALCDLFDKADVSKDGTISIQATRHHHLIFLFRAKLPFASIAGRDPDPHNLPDAIADPLSSVAPFRIQLEKNVPLP